MSVHPQDGSPRTALNSLRRFLQRPAVRERCELCSAPLADQHAHLLDLTSRQLVCACDPCAILFDAQGAGKYQRALRDIRALMDFRLSDEIWQALHLPINLAFFLHNSATGRVVAFYPSPGGATEAHPPPDAWQMLVEDNPTLNDLKPDVEALLVNRLSSPPAYFRLGIDKCYELIGLIRTHWRGLSGGKVVQREIDRFFTDLKERAFPAGGTPHA